MKLLKAYVALGLLFPVATAMAQDVELCGGEPTLFAAIDVRPQLALKQAGLLTISDTATSELNFGGTALARFSCGKNITAAGQVRLHGATNGSNNGSSLVEGVVDEAYLRGALNDGTLFLVAGRQHVVHTVTFGPLSPMDVLARTKQRDYSLTIEQRRRELEGEVMAGVEAFGQGWKVAAYYLPKTGDEVTAAGLGGRNVVPTFDMTDWADRERGEHRGLVSASLIVPDWDLDVTTLGYWSPTPTLALGVSKTASDSLVVYGEAAMLWGGLWPQLIATGSDGGYEFVEPDDGGMRAQMTVGGTYTFQDGTGLSLEYLFNGDGLDGRKFAELVDLAALNGATVDTWFESLGLGRLGGLASYSGRVLLRQHYLFARLAKDNLWQDVNLELTVLKPLEDSSVTFSSRLEQNVIEGLTVGVHAQAALGPDRSEFGIRGDTLTVTLYARHVF